MLKSCHVTQGCSPDKRRAYPLQKNIELDKQFRCAARAHAVKRHCVTAKYRIRIDELKSEGCVYKKRQCAGQPHQVLVKRTEGIGCAHITRIGRCECENCQARD